MRSVVRARHDLLTGLPARGLILEQLASALETEPRKSISLLFVDLDHFKPINDRFGHEVGDAALRTVSERMRALIGPHDCVGRFGGDEFVVVLEVHNLTDDEQFADRLIKRICEPIAVTVGPKTIQVSVGASVGIASNTDTNIATELVRQSDGAMYQAKATGGNRWRRFVDLASAQTQAG